MTVKVRYIVTDIEASIEFYRDRLAFSVEIDPVPGFVGLRRNDLLLLLNLPGAGGAGIAGGTPAPGGWNRFQVEVDDLSTTIQAFAAAGLTFRGDPVEGPGGRQILLEDPSGNVIELLEPPPG